MRVAGWQPFFVPFSRVFSFWESGFFVFQLLFSFFRSYFHTSEKSSFFAMFLREDGSEKALKSLIRRRSI